MQPLHTFSFCLHMPVKSFNMSACTKAGGSGHRGQTHLCESGVGLCEENVELMISALYLDHFADYYMV